MTNREYAELLDFISEKSNVLDNVNVYKVHSSFDTKNNQVSKVTLKVNYTKDGKPLPKEMKGKLPKNVVQRSVQFRGDECTKEAVENWINEFIEEKRGN
jgi:hypothetical protein